ncbi:Predicted ATPase [Nonomuraea solani]|uniref:Predicted ATPase n=1 Tax=Nonomuraea solani TaxID=1144553 RepID=A0A1H6EXM5_9ACTN|nr:BTAD domain-containing putative transcriptional regulator [Nonomuraea solani]SEH01861.1 Predicted ATPase [Nonomuraea solani]
MRIGLLGPLEMRAEDGTSVVVRGARLRALLIALALDPGGLVPAGRLIDAVWGERPPAGAGNALQALVSRLRRVLPVESHPAGYRLSVRPETVDAIRFERQVAAARSIRDADRAARMFREALESWRGPALADVAEEAFFAPAVARLAELRLVAMEERAEAALAGSGDEELVVELTSLVAAHPLRERLAGALMRALAVAGRPAEALGVYERTRTVLAGTLGTDPSPELSALHVAVLRGELGEVPRGERARAVPDGVARGRRGVARTNLRAGLTSFVGREAEVARIRELVGAYRLITLTGPGGSGKTRLAVEAGRELVAGMPDGVWLVELAPAGTEADVAQAVAAALGLREGQAGEGVEPVDRLVAALSERGALVVLDNCEHLIDGVAVLAGRLLAACPRLRILATSREPLGITGEALWPVEPLRVPPRVPPGVPSGAGFGGPAGGSSGVACGDEDMTEVLSYPAVRLLEERARAVRPGFELRGATAVAAVRICQALDGIPLAIELAAARLRTMTAEQLAGRLDDRFRLLTSGDRTALPRHQTLRAVIDWSWNLLTEAERVLLRRLAVFARGATVEAAERVCGGSGETLAVLGSLTDKSLLVAAVDGETPRYGMLETIKEYCLERLDEAGERERIRRAHAAYFAELAETADPYLRGREQVVWLDRLADGHDEIEAALRGAIQAGDTGTAVRLVAGAGWYWLLDWWLRGRKAEGVTLAETALAMPGEAGDEERATACAVIAMFNQSGLGDESKAVTWFATARDLAARTERRHPILRLIEPLDRMIWAKGDGQPTAGPAADEHPWVRAMALLSRGIALVGAGRPGEGEGDLEEALAGFRVIGERWGVSHSLTNLADLFACRGELAVAVARYEEAVAVAGEVVGMEDLWKPRLRLAALRWQIGDLDGAGAEVAAVERDAERIGLPEALVTVAYAKAELARWAGDRRAARAYLGRVEQLSRRMPLNWPFRAMLLDAHGHLDARDGEVASARGRRAEALEWGLRSRSAPIVSQILVGVADQALCQGTPREAARLLVAADAVRGTPDLSLPDAARVEAAARAALGERDFTEEARRGRDATMETVRGLAAGVFAAQPQTSGS